MPLKCFFILLAITAGIQHAHARKLLLKKGDRQLHGITGWGFGYEGWAVNHKVIEHHEEALDTMSAIDAFARQQPESAPRSTTATDNGLSQVASGPDRRKLQQDVKLESEAVVQVNQATHTTIASTLIGRAADGRMDVASAVRFTRPQRNTNSLSVLEFIDSQRPAMAGGH
eukprot:gene8986-9159_t